MIGIIKSESQTFIRGKNSIVVKEIRIIFSSVLVWIFFVIKQIKNIWIMQIEDPTIVKIDMLSQWKLRKSSNSFVKLINPKPRSIELVRYEVLSTKPLKFIGSKKYKMPQSPITLISTYISFIRNLLKLFSFRSIAPQKHIQIGFNKVTKTISYMNLLFFSSM